VIRLVLKTFLCLTLISTSFLACTTSDSGEDESIEDELNAELDDIDGVDDESVSDSGFDDDSMDEGDLADSDSGDESFEDFEDLDADSTADSGDGDDEFFADSGGGEDDDFFAEDADTPSAQGLAEKDLEKELEKGNSISTNSADPSVTAPVEPTPIGETVAGGATANSSPSNPFSDDSFENIVPPQSPNMPNEDLGISDPLVADVDPPLPSAKAANELVPIAKVSKEPFFRNQRLMNTVYVARPGEDLMTISHKIFEKDNTQTLLTDNQYLLKGVDIGDQIYYNSPNRPDDKKEILTYYEDIKMAPQYYITKKGDNIQKIGREVLGYDDAWKEVWVFNDSLQSQAQLPAGLKIRYWSGNELQTPPEAPVSIGSIGSEDTGSENPESPPSIPPSAIETPETLVDVTGPTASMDDPEMNMTNDPAATMPQEIASPVPVVSPVQATESNESLLTIAGIALIGLAVLSLIAIQIKNRKKEDLSMPPSMEFTKV
jgi:hypothetical protein